MGFFSVSVVFFFVFMSQNHADFLGKSIFFPSCRLSGRLEGDFLPPPPPPFAYPKCLSCIVE